MNLACRSYRSNPRTGSLESTSSFVSCYNGMGVVDSFRKQWQTNQLMRWQEYHGQPTQVRVDCHVLKAVACRGVPGRCLCASNRLFFYTGNMGGCIKSRSFIGASAGHPLVSALHCQKWICNELINYRIKILEVAQSRCLHVTTSSLITGVNHVMFNNQFVYIWQLAH